MTAFTDQAAAISKTPITLVIITLDYCGRTFGSAPCTATGLQCYNTFPTCKDKTNYLRQSKDYKYTSFNAPVPFKTGELPYLDQVSLSPTEIKADGLITSRATIDMVDEPDQDVSTDPYLRSRYANPATAPNTYYWKKWKERNRNYNGRRVKIYEGFLGLAEGDFKQVFVGSLEIVKSTDTGVQFTVVDLLKALDKIDIPAKTNVKLTNAIGAADAVIYCYTPNQIQITDLAATGYVRIDDEIIQYSGLDYAQGALTGCTRGAENTVSATHDINKSVQQCRLYGPANPFEIMKTDMLQTDAGYDAGDIDTTAFDYWKTFPDVDINFRRMVSQPTKLKETLFDLVGILNADVLVNEDLKVTCRRRIPNEPGRAYVYFDEQRNITNEGVKVDDNKDYQNSRITRVVVHWNLKPVGDPTKEEDYQRHDYSIDADAESPNEYGDEQELIVFCPWIDLSYLQEEMAVLYLKNQGARILFNRRDLEPVIDFSVEIKDFDIKTGNYTICTTDQVLGRDGNPAQSVFQIIKRQKQSAKSIHFWAVKQSHKRIAYIAADGTNDYANATDAEKEYGFISDDKGFIGEVERSYSIY